MAAQNSRSPTATRMLSSEGSAARTRRLRNSASSAGSSASGSTSGGLAPKASLSQPNRLMRVPPSRDLEALLAELDDVAAQELNSRRHVHAVQVEQAPTDGREARAA